MKATFEKHVINARLNSKISPDTIYTISDFGWYASVHKCMLGAPHNQRIGTENRNRNKRNKKFTT